MTRRANAGRATLLAFPLLGLIAFAQAAESAKPLWPGARYTTADRERAIQRGMRFIYGIATNPKHFDEWGHDLMWCFYTISSTAKDPKLRKLAWSMGHERALRWRRDHKTVPADASADNIADIVFANDEVERLVGPDAAMKEQVRQAAARYTAWDYLRFDPVREPPPSDLPKSCDKCDRNNPRGAAVCRYCNTPLEMRSRYDVWSDALITTYTGDIYGVTLGAPYREVLKWIQVMRPYPPRAQTPTAEFYNVAYAITHVVYTLNDYGKHRLAPAWLPEEYEYLRTNLEEAVKLKDPETLGEFLDTLRAFGMTEADALIRTGVEYVLANQNPDGSWGDTGDSDIYDRYHTTWTAIDGLRQYAWDGERLSFPGLEKLIHSGNERPAARLP